MASKKIRVAFFGNTCNNYYQLIKLLRSEEEFDLHLFIDNRSDPQQRPESDDPEILNDYPDWIHFGDYITTRTILFPWTSPLVEEFDSFDLVVVSHFGPVFTQFSKTPSIFMSLGADLTVHPFAPSFLNLYYHSLKEKIGAIPMSFWQRRGLRRMFKIWTQPFFPFVNALRKLGISGPSICDEYTPIPMDLTPADAERSAGVLPFTDSNYDFLVFYPSRIMMVAQPKLVETGNWKANDIFVQGFKLFLDANPGVRAGLVLIDRPASNDREILRELIRQLKIEENVIWLKPQNGFGYSRKELTEFYSACDVVADDFGVGWFGSVVIEALSLGVNVISYVDEHVMQQIYPWHPILSTREPAQIAHFLEKLVNEPEFKRTVGEKGKRWVKEFHTGARIREQYKQKLLEAFRCSAPKGQAC